jgi:hypothetical protein
MFLGMFLNMSEQLKKEYVSTNTILRQNRK